MSDIAGNDVKGGHVVKGSKENEGELKAGSFKACREQVLAV